jgi:hypothetical protein
VEFRRFVGFETATDGTAVKLLAENVAGRAMSIDMKIETVTALLVTLPKMASKVMERWQGDPKTRILYPLTDFRIDRSKDDRRVLTLGTREGFTVSFNFGEELSEKMGHAHLGNSTTKTKLGV